MSSHAHAHASEGAMRNYLAWVNEESRRHQASSRPMECMVESGGGQRYNDGGTGHPVEAAAATAALAPGRVGRSARGGDELPVLDAWPSHTTTGNSNITVPPTDTLSGDPRRQNASLRAGPSGLSAAAFADGAGRPLFPQTESTLPLLQSLAHSRQVDSSSNAPPADIHGYMSLCDIMYLQQQQQQQSQAQRQHQWPERLMPPNLGLSPFLATAAMTGPPYMAPSQDVYRYQHLRGTGGPIAATAAHGSIHPLLLSCNPSASVAFPPSSQGLRFEGLTRPNAHDNQGGRQTTPRENELAIVRFPVTVSCPMDDRVLTDHQQFIRKQIEVFQATEEDISTHVRGRNKRISLGQVGIRCRHCAHVPVKRRYLGSAYFPVSLLGFYQAAQNMCSVHLQCGRCTELPNEVKDEFIRLLGLKNRTSNGGRAYWAEQLGRMGLTDTDKGVFALRELPHGVQVVSLGSAIPGMSEKRKAAKRKAESL